MLDAEIWSELLTKFDSGAADPSILSIVCNVKASSVKQYDAEKAQRAKEREARNKALETFETTIKDHTWSAKVSKSAMKVAELRLELADMEDSPIVINLADYEEVTGLVKGSGEFSFRVVTRGGEKFPIIELAPGSDIPLVESRSKLETALTAFRLAAADEISELTPDTLKPVLRVNNFDVDENGNVVFDYKAKVSRTELGQTVNNGAKYPHKSGAALVEKGEATFVPSNDEG